MDRMDQHLSRIEWMSNGPMTTTVTGSFSLETLHRTGTVLPFDMLCRENSMSICSTNFSIILAGKFLDYQGVDLPSWLKDGICGLKFIGTNAAVNVYLYPPRR